MESRTELLRDYFVGQLALIMGLEASDLDVEQPLNTLGLDSLMAIELKNNVESRLGVVLPMARFMEGPSVTKLALLVAELIDQPDTVQPVVARGGGQESGRSPLSQGQQALWFLYKLAPESTAYNLCDAVRVR